jgi:DNA-binding transcriptional LysR family regulator
VDTRLLSTLVELERRGTMRAVAQVTGYGTSAVSQQIAALERDVGVQLVERHGRKVRLTAAGRRFAEHARQIIAAEEEARAVLAPDAEPSGLLRVAAYAAAISPDLLTVTRDLDTSHPALRIELQEREPSEVVDLLADDRIDLGYVYDYSLYQQFAPDGGAVQLVCCTPMVLAVPEVIKVSESISSAVDLRQFQHLPWVVNSRGDQDGELVSRLCGVAGFAARVAHRADSLGLILDFVAAELGIAVVPAFAPARAGVRFVPLAGIDLQRRMFAVTRPGGYRRPGLDLIIDRMSALSYRDTAGLVFPTLTSEPGAHSSR